MSGPLPGVLAPLTVPASWLYGLVVDARNARFARGNNVADVEVPVISVGNITVGGVGKTPMVALIAGWLRARGRVPAIAMRGYHASPGEPGDEQLEHRLRLPGVHVVADPDRVAALRSFLPTHPEVDCVILDDGFQHRRLQRDLDLVLIDATRDTLNDRLLPRGFLREPLAGLRRADAVVVTRAAEVDTDLAVRIARLHGRPPVAWCRHAWNGFDRQRPGGPPETLGRDGLRGKRVVTLLGVGNPDSVIDQLRRAGAVIAADIPARDHERYEGPKLTLARGLCDGADALVMTLKDWVKVRPLVDLSSWPVPIVVPRLEIDVFEGADALEQMVVEAVTLR